MIDHIEIRTRDIAAQLRFYGDVLAPLGYTLQFDGASKGFGDGRGLDFFFAEGEPSQRVHFAFAAPSRSVVDRVFETARAAGHRLDRAPALMPQIHPSYYAGFLFDADGHLVEFVCHAAA
jgi:catechol 2,3-dioxygenase-like lactoylglutathione lyase family enzyme